MIIGEASTGRWGFLADLSVRIKILAAIGLAALVALVVGLVTLFALNRAAASAQSIYDNNVLNATQAGLIRAALVQARLDAATGMIAPDAATSDKYRRACAADVAAVNDAIADYRSGTFAGEPAWATGELARLSAELSGLVAAFSFR